VTSITRKRLGETACRPAHEFVLNGVEEGLIAGYVLERSVVPPELLE
jgi:hypothetical protein